MVIKGRNAAGCLKICCTRSDYEQIRYTYYFDEIRALVRDRAIALC